MCILPENESLGMKHPPVQAQKMGLYPTLESLQSVIDLGNSQLPIMNKNVLYGLFMTYHNTLLKQVEATRG